MRIPKEWQALVLDNSLSDGALRTAELLDLLGRKADGMTQAEIAGLRGVSDRQLRTHLAELGRKKTSASINTYKRDKWRPAKRLGNMDIVRELAADRAHVKVAGWMERCARVGDDPYQCVGGHCYRRIVDGYQGSNPRPAFQCGSAECYLLLGEAADREPVTPCRVSEFEVWRDERWEPLSGDFVDQ